MCETQQEIDHYWERLTDGGDPKAQQSGWLKDRFGLSWQVVPAILSISCRAMHRLVRTGHGCRDAREQISTSPSSSAAPPVINSLKAEDKQRSMRAWARLTQNV